MSSYFSQPWWWTEDVQALFFVAVVLATLSGLGYALGRISGDARFWKKMAREWERAAVKASEDVRKAIEKGRE